MARVTTLGTFQGGRPYRKPGKRDHSPALASLKGKLTWNNRRQRAIRSQIEALRCELEALVTEEKALLDELNGVRA